MWNCASIACAEEIRARERLLRERIRRADGTPHPVWPPETDIPDFSAFYAACFAVPHGDRAFLHFRDDAMGGAGGAVASARDRRLAPLLFVYNRQNNLGRIEPTRVLAAIAGAAADPAAYIPGPLWRQSDTVLTGILVKSSSYYAAAAAPGGEESAASAPLRMLVVDDVLVFQGASCEKNAASLAERAPLLQRAILAARAMPNRALRIVPMSHRSAPPGVDASTQWLPDAVWTPEGGYVARFFQLRDVTMASARPFLNLRARNWAATWDAPVVVAGSGVAPVANSGAHHDAETAAKADAAAATAARVFAPMDLDPDGLLLLVAAHKRAARYAHPDDALAFDAETQERHALTDLLQTLCPVYRGPAVFAVQADPAMADIYRLFCLRDGAEDRSGSSSSSSSSSSSRRTLGDAIARHNNMSSSSTTAFDVKDTFPPAQLQFYQLALVPSCGHSARMNAWFGFVPQQERIEWALAGMPAAARANAETQTPAALRNRDGRRILLFECNYDAARHRWIPHQHVGYTANAHRVVGASALVARSGAAPRGQREQQDRRWRPDCDGGQKKCRDNYYSTTTTTTSNSSY
jgi:hypothetical protein